MLLVYRQVSHSVDFSNLILGVFLVLSINHSVIYCIFRLSPLEALFTSSWNVWMKSRSNRSTIIIVAERIRLLHWPYCCLLCWWKILTAKLTTTQEYSITKNGIPKIGRHVEWFDQKHAMGKASRNKANKKKQFYKNPNASQKESSISKEILYGVCFHRCDSHCIARQHQSPNKNWYERGD